MHRFSSPYPMRWKISVMYFQRYAVIQLSCRRLLRNVAQFLSAPIEGVDDLSLSQLGLWSMSSTAEHSGARTVRAPSKDAILLDQKELGSGAQAVVIRVWNVSTGVEYASKKPLKEKHWEFLRREIDLLENIHHVGEPRSQLRIPADVGPGAHCQLHPRIFNDCVDTSVGP